jgi:hypothetical protein
LIVLISLIYFLKSNKGEENLWWLKRKK